MRFIKEIFVHCSAGHGDVNSQIAFWKSKGWKSPGYHREIDYDGSVHEFAPYKDIVNGVYGHNTGGLHISYRGGVEKNNVKIAKDTRTPEQKEGIICEIKNALEFLKEHQDISKIEIKGHRDISPDKNLNGYVDPWERIKSCPSYDAIPEYAHLINEVLQKV